MVPDAAGVLGKCCPITAPPLDPRGYYGEIDNFPAHFRRIEGDARASPFLAWSFIPVLALIVYPHLHVSCFRTEF